MGTIDMRFGGVGRARAGARIVLGVVLGISGALAAPGVVADADSSSDIPGVPLTPGSSSGRSAGTSTTWSTPLSCAPGTVILASLTGSAGTDFDLYLFDSSATTVVTNQGVVARSTGPTSTESLAYATPIGGQFYIDLNSATAAVGTYTLVVQEIKDRPAVATLALGAGHSVTNNLTVPGPADGIRQPFRPGPDGVQQRRDHLGTVATVRGDNHLDVRSGRRQEDALGQGGECRWGSPPLLSRPASCWTPWVRAW